MFCWNNIILSIIRSCPYGSAALRAQSSHSRARLCYKSSLASDCHSILAWLLAVGFSLLSLTRNIYSLTTYNLLLTTKNKKQCIPISRVLSSLIIYLRVLLPRPFNDLPIQRNYLASRLIPVNK